MSCQIQEIARLTDVDIIKTFLFNNSTTKVNNLAHHELPVQECLVSLSSAGDVLSLACQTKIVTLISKWDSQETSEVKNKFHMLWSGEIAKEQNEWITSIICLPLISLGKASPGNGPDWTCVAVGFSTGFLRFYTETGALLLEEQLHNEIVLGIKCQSYSPPRHMGDSGQLEEIHVIYNSAVCVLQGFPLFSTLRACRNHLARVKANCNDSPPITNLAYKKWGFKNQDIANDSEIIGTASVNTFDHLMTASICGGYNATYRSSAPQHNLVIATGKRPFVGFHYALEGGVAPVLSDVAIAMASKLASAISTIAVPWFRGNSKNSTSEKPKTGGQEISESMTCRFGLSDIMREGDNIVSSPNKMLSAVTDAMGRVTLINNRHGIAVRMWKGYRDAQCGWLEIEEDKYHGHDKTQRKTHRPLLRRTLFLVIYAPKKGVIDIWGIQHGSKITTFTASKHGRLLYINYGLVGTNDVAISAENKAQYSCVFVDPLGGIKEITVPFHFALSSQNGQRARDVHLLNKLKTFMREVEYDDEKLIEKITNTCTELKTNEIRIQVMDMIMNNKNITPDALLAASMCFLKQLQEYEKEEFEPTGKTLYQMSTQVEQLIQFYKYIRSRFDTPPEYNTISVNNIPSDESLSTILFTTRQEVNRILKLSKTLEIIKKSNVKPKNKVKFQDDGRSFFEFLSCFKIGGTSSICLKKSIKMEKKKQIAQLIYQGWMYSNDHVETWQNTARKSKIQPLTLMQLALIYWIHKRPAAPLEIEIARFTELLNAICLLTTDVKNKYIEYDEVFSWWKDVRNILIESTNVFNALTVALACRAIIIGFEVCNERVDKKSYDGNGNKTDEIKNSNLPEITKKVSKIPEDECNSFSSEWENVSEDTCQFTLLIGNLEDVTVLNVVVGQQVPVDKSNGFFALPLVNCDTSLDMILSKGKGSVSELVAKWLSTTGIDPAKLIDATDVEFDGTGSIEDSSKMPDPLDEAQSVELLQEDEIKLIALPVEIGNEAKAESTSQTFVLDQLSLLKRHFPYSLTSSVLLANLCWEYAMSWNKQVSQLTALESALIILQLIPMKRMRHGICSLLWTLYVKKKLEAIAKLMNKLGKLPKERLCIQEIGFDNSQLVLFLQHCVTFLDIFLDSEVLEQDEHVVLKSEELWDGHSSGPQPFATLAVSQPPAWYELVMTHWQVTNVLYMMSYFALKVQKPLNNLFDSMTHHHFFQDITDKAIFTWYRDDRRDNMRTEFLCRVITSSMDSIHQETIDGKTLNSEQAFLWMSKCQALASIWKINNDELRIHQVCQLYMNGFDQLADEVVTAVNDVEALAVHLLPIAGRRMMFHLSKTPNLLEQVSQMCPSLTKYLESLNTPELIGTHCSNEDTVELVRRISRFLPENHTDHHVAQLMLDAIFIFECKT